jgi:hypothetical protein
VRCRAVVAGHRLTKPNDIYDQQLIESDQSTDDGSIVDHQRDTDRDAPCKPNVGNLLARPNPNVERARRYDGSDGLDRRQ